MLRMIGSILFLMIVLTEMTTAQVKKPDYIKSRGFFTLNGRIYNADGSEFLMRGVSQNHYWGNESFNLNSINGIAKTHANIVRVVMSNADWQNQSRTPDKKRALVMKYISQGLVPMVEQHDGTCDSSPEMLDFITDIWTDPANVAWLNEFEEYVILNIANEWGPSDDSD
ncbi:MAG: glycoside hydrolase family 5 protein, partial [candidate division KSB1 bacterium]|nr:glycoside hydrolase family 5 protein [candidate division KSB1 bacterium]